MLAKTCRFQFYKISIVKVSHHFLVKEPGSPNAAFSSLGFGCLTQEPKWETKIPSSLSIPKFHLESGGYGVLKVQLGGGNSNIFLISPRRTWGFMIQFDDFTMFFSKWVG